MNKIEVSFDYENYEIIIKTNDYKRSIKCKSFESFKEEIRRLFRDLEDYNKSFKESK